MYGVGHSKVRGEGKFPASTFTPSPSRSCSTLLIEGHYILRQGARGRPIFAGLGTWQSETKTKCGPQNEYSQHNQRPQHSLRDAFADLVYLYLPPCVLNFVEIRVLLVTTYLSSPLAATPACMIKALAGCFLLSLPSLLLFAALTRQFNK